MNAPARSRSETVLPWAIASSYAAVYAFLGFLRYSAYRASCDDGTFLQTIASAFHGFFNTTEAASHFTYHFSPVLYLLAPLVWTWPSALTLIVAAAVAGALTIPPLFFIARRRLPLSLALGVAVVVALYPALGGVTFTDFTEDALAPAAAAWLIWAIDGRRFYAAAIFAALCLCIKEDQAIVMAWLGAAGAVYFASKRERRWSLFCVGLACVAIATLGAFLLLVRPAAGAAYGYPSIRDFYGPIAPGLVFDMFTGAKLGYLFAIFLPLLGIPLLSRVVLLAIPGLLECLLSRVPVTFMVGQHYAATWIPYVLVAFVLGIAALRERAPHFAGIGVVACLGISTYTNLWASPNQWSVNLSRPGNTEAALDRMIEHLPPAASVTAFCPVYAHLGAHPRAAVYTQAPADYIILIPSRDPPDWLQREREYIATSRAYTVIETDPGVELLQRRL